MPSFIYCDTAITKVFAIISPSFTYEQAVYFSDLIHKCLNYELGDFDPSIGYQDIFPPFPKLEELNEGFTNVIKETTLNFANVTIKNIANINAATAIGFFKSFCNIADILFCCNFNVHHTKCFLYFRLLLKQPSFCRHFPFLQ